MPAIPGPAVPAPAFPAPAGRGGRVAATMCNATGWATALSAIQGPSASRRPAGATEAECRPSAPARCSACVRCAWAPRRRALHRKASRHIPPDPTSDDTGSRVSPYPPPDALREALPIRARTPDAKGGLEFSLARDCARIRLGYWTGRSSALPPPEAPHVSSTVSSLPAG